MAKAKYGDTVKVHYTGVLEDGTIAATTFNREPLQFTIGKREVISVFEEAVLGMNVGESKTTTAPMEKAFGPHKKELIKMVDRSKLPADFKLEVGKKLKIKGMNGQTIVVRVSEVSEQGITLDANHPLAGRDLTFNILLVDIF